MANSIALAERYSPILDGLYQKFSVTSVLDTPSDLVMWDGADTAKIYKASVDGLASYDRNSGYVKGDVNGSWESMELKYERGRQLLVDVMDNEETLDMAFGTVAQEFERLKVVPEADAYTIAKIAGTSNIQAATPADFGSISNVLTAVDNAQKALDEEEVPEEGRILFVSNDVYYALKDKLTRMIMNRDEIINRNFEFLDDTRVIKVPTPRFNTAIQLLDGTTAGQTAGGYSTVPGTGYSYKINFLLVHPSAVIKVMKHRITRIFSPEVVQDADAYKINFRLYGDTFVMDNKKKGIYLHRYSTANS